jgi:hypothetical protein
MPRVFVESAPTDLLYDYCQGHRHESGRHDLVASYRQQPRMPARALEASRSSNGRKDVRSCWKTRGLIARVSELNSIICACPQPGPKEFLAPSLMYT